MKDFIQDAPQKAPNDEQKQLKLDYLVEAYEELRDELKMRITQRDNFAIQFVVTTGVLLGVAFTDITYAAFCILVIPIMSLFFTTQIFSSYTIHDRLSKFIRENIETQIGKLIDIPEDQLHMYFWEQYCLYDRKLHKVKLPGIRKAFFEKTLIIIPLVSSFLFFVRESKLAEIPYNVTILIAVISCVVYLCIGIYLLYAFNCKPKIIETHNLAQCDYKKFRFFKQKPCKAAFIDRDGTLHIDKVMTHKIEDLEFFTDTISTLKYLKEKNFKLIIITNQSGIAKGVYSKKEMHKFNTHLRKELKKHGCAIDAIYFCPHLSDSNCYCAKPKTGMIERACIDFNIDLKESFLVGDKMTDILAAKKMGIKSYLVTTGIYKNNDYHTEAFFDETVNVIHFLGELKTSV